MLCTSDHLERHRQWVQRRLLLFTVLAIAALVPAAALKSAPDDILYRVNAGGPELASADGGIDWAADTAANPSDQHNQTGRESRYATSTVDATVPPGTPVAVFESGRWTAGDSEPLAWTFPVAPGTYEVRLYFADSHSSLPGQRAFDVLLENRPVLTDYDIVAEAGSDIGTMKSFRVEVSDGALDVDFLHGSANNPILNAIEIVAAARAANELGASPAVVDFDRVTIGTTESVRMTLYNLGIDADPSIELNDIDLDAHAAFGAVLGDRARQLGRPVHRCTFASRRGTATGSSPQLFGWGVLDICSRTSME